jgi:hypothetical protein
LIGENLEVSKILEEWRVGLEGNKLWISRTKTEYIEYDFGGNNKKLWVWGNHWW